MRVAGLDPESDQTPTRYHTVASGLYPFMRTRDLAEL